MSAHGDPGRTAARRTRRRAETAAVLLLATLLWTGVAACEADRRAIGVPSDSAYVDVMARLSLIERTLGREPQRADSARRATLEDRGTSAEALRRYARRYGDDPEHMLAIWRAIESRMERLQESAEAREHELRLSPEPSDEDAEPAGSDPPDPGETGT